MRIKKLNKNFSAASETYLDYSQIQNESAILLLEEIKRSKFVGGSPKNILDIGCGPGNYTNLLAEYFDKSMIFAFDISDAMVNIAKKNNQNPRIKYFTADGENLGWSENYAKIVPCHPKLVSGSKIKMLKQVQNDSLVMKIESEKFDLITSNATIQWFENIEKPLEIYKQMLTENGCIIFSVFGPKTFCELGESVSDLNQKISAFQFRSKDEYAAVLREKFGCDKFKITEKFITKDYQNLMSLLRSIKNTGTQGNNNNKIWTKNMIDELDQIYSQKFGKIVATYHLIFCEMRQK